MFHSAIVKLTCWYLLILASVCILFSFATYTVATNEIHDRLRDFQNRFEEPGMVHYTNPSHRLFSEFRDDQRETANHNLLVTLLYINVLVIGIGGFLSYLLARRTLRQIEESHDAQVRFTSDASHELRTPLAAMKTELEVALRDPTLAKKEMRELLDSNLEEVNRLTSMTHALLMVSRLDYASLEFKVIDIRTTLQEAVQRYDKNLSRIELSLPKQELCVKANKSGIEELFTILIDNALKYSPPNSKIKATLSKSGKQAIFTITNSGRGITREQLPHIFERFYRADNSRTDGGAGLGLSLAKEITAMHKGELSVSSTVGKETTFTVLLPLTRNGQA